MLIIVEGPDGSGKTTLARRFSDVKLLEIHHHGPYPGIGCIARQYRASIIRSLRPKSATVFQGVVMDRSWYSEPIYGRAKRNGQDRIGMMRRVLEREAYGAGGVVVLSKASFAWCLEKWRKNRADQYVQEAQTHEVIWHEYQHLAIDLPTVEFDPEAGLSTHQVLEQVDSMRTENQGPGLGCWKPGNVLIVEDWPWHDQYVEEALDSYGISERDLYWVAPGDDPKFLEGLEPSAVVAVGEDSDDWCHAAGIERWHTAAPEDLAKVLNRVTKEVKS